MTIRTNPVEPTPDRLSSLLERFRVRAQLHHAGTLCGITHFDAADGHAYLHVLRRGHLEVSHPAARGRTQRLRFTDPTLLLYPVPFTHRFHNPPVDGSDFTCARLRFDGGANHPLARALGPFIALPLDKVPGLAATLELLFAETDQVRCGHRLLADRLFEVVLIQLLRWLLDQPEQIGRPVGLIAGLSDPKLSRALVAMHDAPGQAWSLDSMAACAGMSRTVFAARFREVVGQTPAAYLTAWRMALAQSRLSEGASLKQLADELGYGSAAALSRAFLSTVGMSATEWLATRRRMPALAG
jgi:AraC-like DNA-binding protein